VRVCARKNEQKRRTGPVKRANYTHREHSVECNAHYTYMGTHSSTYSAHTYASVRTDIVQYTNRIIIIAMGAVIILLCIIKDIMPTVFIIIH